MKLYLNILKHILFNNLGIVPAPSLCTFLVTWRCELRCYMCNIPNLGDKSEMNLDQIKAIFNQLNTLDAVRLTGGEPFVREDLSEIVEHILETSNPSTIILNTNGFQTSKIIGFAERFGSPGFHFRVSLDGVGERHDEIRCMKGAYDKALDTLKELIRLRKALGLCIGVNLTITRRNIDQIGPLQELCQGLGVDLIYQIARDDRYLLEPEPVERRRAEFSFFDSLSQKDLEGIVEMVSKDTRSYNFREGLVKRFFNEGLRNRLLYGKKVPSTRCVALTSHIRILPNGELPICIHSGTRVGDLRRQDFRELWFGPEIERYRRMVRECPGCWIPCEVAPNAIYTGSILRSFFYG